MKKVALFLGAGASVPYNKPVTSTLRDILIAKYGRDSQDELRSVVHAIVSKKSLTDIEYVLQAVRDIRAFSDTYGAQCLFFDNAPDYVLSAVGRNVELRKVIRQATEIQHIIEKEIFEHYRWDSRADHSVVTICDLLFQSLEKYTDSINVFTTNYDKAIERFCDRTRAYDCVDGFEWDSDLKANIWQGGIYNHTGKRKPIYLHKLHGSLGWKEHLDGMIVNTGEEGISDDHNFKNNVVIYPTLCPKDGEEKQPFKNIRDRFDKYLEEAGYCIVIGFSFRDEHVNKIFRKFLERRGIMIVISRTASDNFNKNFLKFSTIPPSDEERKKYAPRLLMNASLSVDTAEGIAKTIEKVIQENPS